MSPLTDTALMCVPMASKRMHQTTLHTAVSLCSDTVNSVYAERQLTDFPTPNRERIVSSLDLLNTELSSERQQPGPKLQGMGGMKGTAPS